MVKGKLTAAFFDNAWEGLGKNGYYSANYEFVRQAKESGFDLTQELEIQVASSSGNYCLVAKVPFNTMCRSWHGFISWDGFIPLHKNEVEYV